MPLMRRAIPDTSCQRPEPQTTFGTANGARSFGRRSQFRVTARALSNNPPGFVRTWRAIAMRSPEHDGSTWQTCRSRTPVLRDNSIAEGVNLLLVTTAAFCAPRCVRTEIGTYAHLGPVDGSGVCNTHGVLPYLYQRAVNTSRSVVGAYKFAMNVQRCALLCHTWPPVGTTKQEDSIMISSRLLPHLSGKH